MSLFLNKKIFPSTNFLHLWLYQLVGLFGGELSRFAFPVWLFQHEENLISYSVFISCGLLPRIFSPIFGALIDYFNKKKILFASGIIFGVLTLILVAIVEGLFVDNFMIVCCLMFSFGVFSNVMHMTAISIVPHVVSSDGLLKANSLMIAAESSVVLICPILSGILIALYGISFVLFFDILLFIVSLVFLSQLNLNVDNRVFGNFSALVGEIKINLKRGMQFIKNDENLIFLLIIFGLINFCFSFSFVAFTPMVLSVSQNNTMLLGKINSIGSGSQLLASLFSGFLFKNDAKIEVILKLIICLGLFGPLIIGLKCSPICWIIGYASTLSIISIINNLNNTYWQKSSPSDLQGTIFGIRRMISSAIAPVGALLAGPFISVIFTTQKSPLVENEYQIIFMISGFLILFTGFLGYFINIFKQEKLSLLAKNE